MWAISTESSESPNRLWISLNLRCRQLLANRKAQKVFDQKHSQSAALCPRVNPRKWPESAFPMRMATLEYLQKQLQREFYAYTDDLTDRTPFYLTNQNDDLIEDEKARSEHRLLFDKVLSSYHKPNVSVSLGHKEIFGFIKLEISSKKEFSF